MKMYKLGTIRYLNMDLLKEHKKEAIRNFDEAA